MYRRIRQAKFPVVKTMDSFDFLAIPSVNKTMVLELARSEFLARRENVLLLAELAEQFDIHPNQIKVTIRATTELTVCSLSCEFTLPFWRRRR